MVDEYKFGHADARATPEYIKSLGIGAALTTGNISKLASAVEALDGVLAEIAARITKLEKQRNDDAKTRAWEVVR